MNLINPGALQRSGYSVLEIICADNYVNFFNTGKSVWVLNRYVWAIWKSTQTRPAFWPVNPLLEHRHLLHVLGILRNILEGRSAVRWKNFHVMLYLILANASNVSIMRIAVRDGTWPYLAVRKLHIIQLPSFRTTSITRVINLRVLDQLHD